MAQLNMEVRWWVQLNADEMKLVTLALAGKLKPDTDEAAAARELLQKMTKHRLAAMREQVTHLERFVPEDAAMLDALVEKPRENG